MIGKKYKEEDASNINMATLEIIVIIRINIELFQIPYLIQIAFFLSRNVSVVTRHTAICNLY